VAAGPAANLLLAVLLYASVNWIGVNEPRALLSAPAAGRLAERAGLRAGDLVRARRRAGVEPDTCARCPTCAGA
jgi:regulator of sigma E protease